MNNLVKTSYSKDDVIVLLKDLSKDMKEMSTEEREKAIQSGTHYSEMLPEEKIPSPEYEALYRKALARNKREIAEDIAKVAEIMLSKSNREGHGTPVIISLARAGLPVGILIKRYIKRKYGIICPHYAISIIRDKGFDNNAMEYIYQKEVVENDNYVSNFFFVDGWTGKGAIKTQLKEAVEELTTKITDSAALESMINGNDDYSGLNINHKWEDLSDDLYVLADPANITPYCGTHDDYLLPSACLNSTVSGLTSRTILNKYIDVENGDFHGATYFEKFENIDQSNAFLDEITAEFGKFKSVDSEIYPLKEDFNGMSIVKSICSAMDIKDLKKIKPGIGETTRVLLRRIPWKILINENITENHEDIEHILVLCKEKNIPVEKWNLGNYKVCGIIKELSADA